MKPCYSYNDDVPHCLYLHLQISQWFTKPQHVFRVRTKGMTEADEISQVFLYK